MGVPRESNRVPAEGPGIYDGSDGRVSARWCGSGLARAAWAALAVLSVTVFAVSLPAYYDRLHSICTAGACLSQQLRREGARALGALSISQDLYAMYFLGLAIITAGTYFLVAALIAWRAPEGWMALFAASMLVLFGPVVSEAPAR